MCRCLLQDLEFEDPLPASHSDSESGGPLVPAVVQKRLATTKPRAARPYGDVSILFVEVPNSKIIARTNS